MYKKIKEIDIEEIKIAVKNCSSLRNVIKFLGCNPKNGNEMVILGNIVRDCNINTDHHKSSFNYTKISGVISECYSFIDVAKKIGIIKENARVMGARIHRNIRDYISENNIDISHFKRSYKGRVYYYKDEDLFVNNSTASNYTIKKRFISIVKYECCECNISDWNKKPISLEMDHIDGNPRNNVLNNLRLLCPNCHSQTETFGVKNRSKTIDTQNK